MRRREFISLLGGAAAWPRGARAQQPGKLPTVGFLISGTRASHGLWFGALAQRLHELGWIENRTIAIEYRWGDGRNDRFTEIAAEFVARKVDIIVTGGNALGAAAKATSTIPIIFALAADPLGTGAIASLARPGGNVTGLSTQNTDRGGKRIELLREMVPNLRRLGIMGNASYPAALLEMDEVRTVAQTLGLEPVMIEIRRAEDIVPALEHIKGRADALHVIGDAFVSSHRVPINTLSLSLRLPTTHNNREYVEAGGLMSYGPNIPDLFRRAAEYVDKILRGTKPGDIPVEQPTKFDLVINLTTAKALRLTVPPTLLARADEVIE